MAEILIYTVATHLGGAERSLLEYIFHAHQEGKHRLHIVVPKASGPFLGELARRGIPYRVIEMPASLLGGTRQAGARAASASLANLLFSADTWRYAAQIRRELKARRPGLVYTNGLKCHLLGALLALGLGIPVLWHLRDQLSGPTGFLFRAFYRAFPRVRAVANSQFTAGRLSRKFPPPVVYNGVAEETFSFVRGQQLHTELKLPTATRFVGILGVLARWKGQESFLEMAALLAPQYPHLHFVVIGEQIYDTEGDQGFRQKLIQLSQGLGLERRVSFLGFRQDTPALLQSIDVLVHASLRPEPFGRVIIEAMATGTPVTASNEGGPREILRPGVDGLLHSPGNPQAMAANVEKLLDPDFAETLRREARGRFLSHFSHQSYCANLQALLDERIAGR